MTIDEDRLRAQPGGRPQRHCGMDAELTCRVGCRGDDAALIGLAADHDGLADEGGIGQFFHGDEEGVHVDVEVGAHCSVPGYSRPLFDHLMPGKLMAPIRKKRTSTGYTVRVPVSRCLRNPGLLSVHSRCVRPAPITLAYSAWWALFESDFESNFQPIFF